MDPIDFSFELERIPPILNKLSQSSEKAQKSILNLIITILKPQIPFINSKVNIENILTFLLDNTSITCSHHLI